MFGHGRFLLFLLRPSLRQLTVSIQTRGTNCGLIQHRTWTSAARTVCLRRLEEIQPAVRLTQHQLCTKTGGSCENEYPTLPDYRFNLQPVTKEVYIVQVQGLPWSCTAQDLLQFFSECRIRDGVKGIHLLLDRLGRPSGRAFIEMEHEEDVSKALEKHLHYLGPRYIQGLDIAENGITIVTNSRGLKSGEAFVQFTSQEAADEALQRNREIMGSRYIEVFPSRKDDIHSTWRRKMSPVSPHTSPLLENRTTASAMQARHKIASSQRDAEPLHYIRMRGLPFQVTAKDIVKTGGSCENEYPTLPDYRFNLQPVTKEVYIVKVQGLPWSCTAQDLLQFFSECRIRDGVKGIHLPLDRLGRPSGRAFIEMEHEEDVSKALEKHLHYLGPRYIQVFEVTNSDAEAILKSDLHTEADDGVVLLRGLPFSCTEHDIAKFFSGLDIAENGITIVTNSRGLKSGEAFVQFTSQEAADKALQRIREIMGSRYIEVLPSRKDDIHSTWRRKMSPVSPHTSPLLDNRTTASAMQARHKIASSQRDAEPLHYMNMRGLPFQVTAEDIVKTGGSCENEYPTLPDHQSNLQPVTKEVYIVQVQGLPWSCTAQDLLQFFSECRIRDGVKGIHLLLDRLGRPSGRAFIEMEHEEDVSKALKKHLHYLGPRYIQVFEVTNSDAEAILKSDLHTEADDGVVLLRGLPFSCTEHDIAKFFSGLDIAENGITIVTNSRGLKSGEAFVQFTSQEAADKALQRNREIMGSRYIEVFPSRKDDIHSTWRRKMSPVSPHTSPLLENRTTASAMQARHKIASSQRDAEPLHYIRMRGLSLQVTVEDIVKFFSPLAVFKIMIEFGPNGRPSGEADVYFSCHEEAVAAMSRDKMSMGHRYIELFLNSVRDSDRR
ncbi:uncharacterized protein KZ484_003779 isoform 2-T2 [Pholidichthys leucotaenia]